MQPHLEVGELLVRVTRRVVTLRRESLESSGAKPISAVIRTMQAEGWEGELPCRHGVREGGREEGREKRGRQVTMRISLSQPAA